MRFLSFLLLGCFVYGSAIAGQITNMRTWTAPDNTRIVFDLGSKTDFKLFKMGDQRRVVLDLSNCVIPRSIVIGKDRIVGGIRSASRPGGDARVVFDVLHPVEVKAFAVPPGRQYGHRLVIDFIDKDYAHHLPLPTLPPLVERKDDKSRYRDIVIAIDAGHGGEDPGAESATGTREKDIVLAIARRLATIVDAERGMRATLIRDGDYFIGLRDRIQRARDRRADLFVSIHADAFRNTHASGSSVFVLSRHGASSEAARWLANQENQSDLVGGVSLERKDDMVKLALLDISQVGVMDASATVARKVLWGLRKLHTLHHNNVQRAGFVVLKSPDIPSILVETAFLTNIVDERKLRDPSHQQALAVAIMDGIRSYFVDGAPPGTLFAQEKERLSHADQASTVSRMPR